MADEAEKILVGLGLTYRGLTSYSDKGFMESMKQPGTSAVYTTVLTFSTYFRRPNFFRFEWCDLYRDGGDNVIWSDGKNTFEKYSFEKGIKRARNIELLVAGATGVSSATAHNISSLLMEQVGGRKFTDMTDVLYRGTERVEGEDCHHLHDAHDNCEIFVSKSRNVILKIHEDHVIAAEDTGEALKAVRFISFGLFSEWLKYTLGFRPKPERDLHVVTSTVYQDVLLNPDLPDNCFSKEGPRKLI